MKKQLALLLAVLLVVVSFAYPIKAESKLKLSESDIEFYPSQRYIITVSATSDIDENKLQSKSSNLKVEKVACFKNMCALSFVGFDPTNDKVEIKYEDQLYYVNVKVKSFDNLKQNMSLEEQYKIALAKLLTKYNVVVPDDIKDEKVRFKVEDEIEKLKDKYTDPKDRIEVKEETTPRKKTPEIKINANKKKVRWESPEVGNVMLTKNAKTSGIIYGHAGIHGKLEYDVIETRGFGPDGVKSYPGAELEWRHYPVKTGIWTVKGTTKAQRLKATRWAWDQRGKPYLIDPNGTKTFFCTKLVWKAWESQKKKIGHYWFATEMMTSTALKVKTLYHK